MKVATIFDAGNVSVVEDQWFVRLPFFGVLDGCSAPYLPSQGPRLFYGRSGGQVVCDAVSEVFSQTRVHHPLCRVLRRAVGLIKWRLVSRGYVFPCLAGRSDLLPAASFAVAKIGEKEIHILQGGDSLALWVLRSGEIKATRNQVSFDGARAFAELIAKHLGDRDKARKEFAPILGCFARQKVNNPEDGYAVLNGQREVERCWEHILLPREHVATLLLFTDGLAFCPFDGDARIFARKVASLYADGGLEAILKETRQDGKNHGEATAVAIEF